MHFLLFGYFFYHYILLCFYLLLIMSAHIYYFPGAGRAEAIKLSLDLAGIPYTFKGVENWPEEKAEGLKTGSLPFGQVPMVEMDGLHMVQTLAILNHISRV